MVNMEPKCFQSSDMCISRMRKSLMSFCSAKSVTGLTIERTTPISCIAAPYFLAIFLVTSFATAAGFKGSYDCLIYNRHCKPLCLQRCTLLRCHSVLRLDMVSNLGVLACPLSQRKIPVLAAPDIKLVNNKVSRNTRQELRRLLRLDYPVFSAVFCERGKQIVKCVYRIPYSLRRLKLHDKQPACQLRPKIESNEYKPFKQLPDALKIVLGVRKATKSLVIIFLRLRNDIIEYTPLSLEHRVKHRPRDICLLAYFIDTNAIVDFRLEQLNCAFCYVLLDFVRQILQKSTRKTVRFLETF